MRTGKTFIFFLIIFGSYIFFFGSISILGVAADCSQELVRKHYKKIAVLVHPDKNKQAGAEEAFKILQRAFELIGEPECRQAYDKSLAEALNAEKACSEINELLTQLQTKIAEAANTIR